LVGEINVRETKPFQHYCFALRWRNGWLYKWQIGRLTAPRQLAWEIETSTKSTEKSSQQAEPDRRIQPFFDSYTAPHLPQSKLYTQSTTMSESTKLITQAL